jgi:hypothetical protein
MDSNRFDRWTRNFAHRLSRRDALRLAGAGGASATLATHALPALAQAGCSLQIHAETVAGPSSPAAYDGSLSFTIGDDGAFTQASFTPNGGQALPATGRATGRAIDFLVTFEGNQLVSFAGTAAQPLASCQGEVAGTFSGPQPGDLGGWQATTGAGAAASAPKNQPTTGGQSATGGQSTTGSAPASTGGQSADSAGSCSPDQTPCQTDAECCNGFCDHASGSCATCNGLVCGTIGCVDPTSDRKNCGACGNACPDNAGACVDGACVCLPDGAACTVPAECCGLLCPEGRDLCGCSQIGEKCAGIDDCCQPSNGAQIGCLGGDNDDICVGMNNAPCTSNTDCLSQNCVNGFCG